MAEEEVQALIEKYDSRTGEATLKTRDGQINVGTVQMRGLTAQDIVREEGDYQTFLSPWCSIDFGPG